MKYIQFKTDIENNPSSTIIFKKDRAGDIYFQVIHINLDIDYTHEFNYFLSDKQKDQLIEFLLNKETNND